MVWARSMTCPHLPFGKMDPDLCLLICMLLVVAVALVSQLSLALFVCQPQALLAGEWWRLLTWPFAHVSLYHLLLDGTSFVFLYQALQALGTGRRRWITFASFAGSLFAAAFASGFQEQGLCGLSGPAHGLMAVLALSLCRSASSKPERSLGVAVFALVLLKALTEACSGHVVLESFHLGAIGSPNPYTHLGGVLGGLAVFLFLAPKWSALPPNKHQHL